MGEVRNRQSPRAGPARGGGTPPAPAGRGGPRGVSTPSTVAGALKHQRNQKAGKKRRGAEREIIRNESPAALNPASGTSSAAGSDGSGVGHLPHHCGSIAAREPGLGRPRHVPGRCPSAEDQGLKARSYCCRRAERLVICVGPARRQSQKTGLIPSLANFRSVVMTESAPNSSPVAAIRVSK